jgi:hypothetical protein
MDERACSTSAEEIANVAERVDLAGKGFEGLVATAWKETFQQSCGPFLEAFASNMAGISHEDDCHNYIKESQQEPFKAI